MALDVKHPIVIKSDGDPFPPELTHSLAYDLALRTSPFDVIALNYELTTKRLTDLVKNNPLLRETYKGIRLQLKGAGLDAGFNIRTKAVTEAMLPAALEIVRDPNGKHSDKARIISTFMTHQTNQEKNKISASGGPSTAVQVIFNTDSRIRGMGRAEASVIQQD